MEKSRFIITDLRQGIKNPNRVNVFVDEKYTFSLDVAQIVDFGVKVGQELSEDELEEFKKVSEFGKLYQRALEWTLMRPRSEKEVRDYLNKKIYEKKLNKDYIEDIIGRLKDKKYVDDVKFAEWYVENRFIKKGISRKRLSMELMKKGIARGVIEDVLNGRDDETELRKMIAKKQTRYTDEKLMAYLVRQGFSYDLVKKVLAENND